MGIQILKKTDFDSSSLFTPEALKFFETIHETFNPEREKLLESRIQRFKDLKNGKTFGFLSETKSVRDDTSWKVAPAPADLNDRRVEITGPVERKMMINAMNCGAKVFMADFEDSLSPTWGNVVAGIQCLKEASNKTLTFKSPEGKDYRLNPQTATLVVRPRGWHLIEDHVLSGGRPVSASLFDFSMTFFHTAQNFLDNGSGPYFYLPKMESHLEARLWNRVFEKAQALLNIPKGTIRATVLIETLPAAFEMEEILFELRDHAAGLNAGRWDYIFSAIKKYHFDSKAFFPDRSQITMTAPFMRAYSELLIKTCHRRGAHAMGGMSAFIPNRKDAAVTEKALAKVREDKERECRDGCDGTWVAHPDLVKVAIDIFDKTLGSKPNQKDRLREDVKVEAKDLVNFTATPGEITVEGIRNNINVALQYIESWLRGVGAVAIHNLMEDAATAEISRAELWHWIHNGFKMADGKPCTRELYEHIKQEELKAFDTSTGRWGDAVRLLDSLVLEKEFTDFLTLPAYGLIREK